MLINWKEDRAIMITLAAGVLGVAAIYFSNKTGFHFSDLAPVGALLGIALLVAAFRNWELGVKALLVTVVVEGAIRKWFLPSASELVYFYKDILMMAILAGYMVGHNRLPLIIKRNVSLLTAVLTLFAVYAVAVMFNPSAPHILVSVLGVKAYCLYIPLAFILPRMFSTREKLVAFLKWYLVIVLPVALVGAIQFMEPDQSSAINRYAWREDPSSVPTDVASFFDSAGTNYVRITSTFSYVSGLSAYLPIMFGLLLALTSLKNNCSVSRGLKVLYFVAIGAVIVTSFMTGSRGAVLTIVAVASFFYCFTSHRDIFRRLMQVTVIGVLAYIGLTTLLPQAYDAFYTRAFSGEAQIDEGLGRVLDIFTIPFEEASYAGPLGYGIGSTQNSVPALMRTLDLTFQGEALPMAVEGETGRIMLELGILGFSLYLLSRLVLVLTLVRVCLLIRDSESKVIAIAVLAILLCQVVSGGAIVSHTQNVYQWFLVGVILALLNAERLAPMKEKPDNSLRLQRLRQLDAT